MKRNQPLQKLIRIPRSIPNFDMAPVYRKLHYSVSIKGLNLPYLLRQTFYSVRSYCDYVIKRPFGH